MYSHVITTRNVRSASQQTPQWPHSRFSWTLQQRRWKQWSQLDTRRWSPGDRRKRRHTSLQQRRHKWDRLLGETWIVIAGSIIPAFSSVNECLFNSWLWDHDLEVNLIKHFPPEQMTQVEAYLCTWTASGPGTFRLASLLWLWSLGPAFQFVHCLQPFSVWPDDRNN